MATNYTCTEAKYKQNSSGWYAAVSQKVSTGWNSTGTNKYQTRLAHDFAAIRAKNVTDYIVAAEFWYKQDNTENAHPVYLRITDSAYADIASGSYGTSVKNGWAYITLSAAMIAALVHASAAYVGTYGTANGTYIVFYGEGTDAPYLKITWATRNTAPYWGSATGAATNAHVASGIIPENDTTLSVSWDAATDAEGDTLYYAIWRETSTGSSTLVEDSTTSRSLTDTIGAGNAGVGYRYRIQASDGSLTTPTYLYTNWIYKNTFTGGVLSGTPSLGFSTATLALSRTNSANTFTGAVTNTYTLGCTEVTLYNTNCPTTDATITIWRTGGYPAGPYIKFADIVTAFGPNYTGILHLRLVATNSFGSSYTSYVNVAVDIRTTPSAVTGIGYTNGYTIGGVVKFLPDQRAITVSWTAATNDLGGTIYYDIQYKLSTDSTWTTAVSGTTGVTGNIAPPSGATQLTYNVRVIARMAYGSSSTTNGSNLLIDKYLAPLLTLVSKTRLTTSIEVNILVTERTSLSLGIDAFTYLDLDDDPVDISAGGLDNTFTYTPILITDSYTMVVSFTDDSGFDPVTLNVNVNAYIPMFSVRRKGVGINEINDGTSGHILRATGNIQITGTLNVSDKATAKSLIVGTDPSLTASDGSIRAGNNIACGGTMYMATTHPVWSTYNDHGLVPAGAIFPFAGASTPAGWLLCDGSAVSRTTYADLYAAIGTAFGAGDGSTTFNIPNLQERFPAGYKSGSSWAGTRGGVGGAATHTLSVTEMPSHQHNLRLGYGSGSMGSSWARVDLNNPNAAWDDVDAAGGGGAHNNLPPYIILLFIIRI